MDAFSRSWLSKSVDLIPISNPAGFEIGIKSTLLDNQLRLNASIYSFEIEDLQLDYFDSAAIVFLTINAGQASSDGAELDLEYAPFAVPGLTLRGTLAYNQAEYDQFIAPCWDGQSVAQGCSADLPGYPGKSALQPWATDCPSQQGAMNWSYSA